jgi:hypothetical protein
MPLVYKYLPPERISYFLDENLRFSPPSALNDPYEGIPKLPDNFEKIILETISNTIEDEKYQHLANREAIKQKIKVGKENPSELINVFNCAILKNMDKKIGILSLSKRWDSTLMWSHYAMSHQGICLGFDQQHEFFKYPNVITNRSEFILGDVIYSQERSNLRGIDPCESEIDNYKIIFTKSIDWKYEEEVRAICRLKDANEIIEAKPFNISLFEIPHQAVKEVIVGLRVGDSTYQSAKNFAMQNSIPIYRTMLSDRTYDLRRYQVNA